MEFGAEYTFSSADQFWQELEDVISISPWSTLDELDAALRNYLALVAHHKDEFLTDSDFDQALFALLNSQVYNNHVDRMMSNIIATITPSAPSSTLFVALMLILHMGMTNPLSASINLVHSETKTSAKVFRIMRKRWNEVVPVLMKWVWDADVVHETHPLGSVIAGNGKGTESYVMPAEGWDERIGLASTLVLYEVCRVQKLSADELSLFTYEFVSHLFSLVEQTRDKTDETFNYTLIKLIIALNEQFMVASVPPPDGSAMLPPPILPDIVGERKRMRGPNFVLEVLRSKESESKTFGENIIFILNRANGSPDSLCVSLLILKILYLLFTTSGTQEYFYTNDLCVLVDVFIRELCDLGPESEGLKHTYLRVLHPLLTNTQLRQHPYKRPQLRKVLRQLVSESHYRACDPTTRRLVERNLRGSWCESLSDDLTGDDSGRRAPPRQGSSNSENEQGYGWSSGIGGASSAAVGRHKEARGSSWSIDAVAQAEEAASGSGSASASGARQQASRSIGRRSSRDEVGLSPTSAGEELERPRSAASSAGPGTPMSSSAILEPLIEGAVTAPSAVSSSHYDSSSSNTPSSLSTATFDPAPVPSRRRRPPPPPSTAAAAAAMAASEAEEHSSRPRSPLSSVSATVLGSVHAPAPPRSPAPGQRRAAPVPPCRRNNAPASTALESEMDDRLQRLRVE